MGGREETDQDESRPRSPGRGLDVVQLDGLPDRDTLIRRSDADAEQQHPVEKRTRRPPSSIRASRTVSLAVLFSAISEIRWATPRFAQPGGGSLDTTAAGNPNAGLRPGPSGTVTAAPRRRSPLPAPA